MDWANGRVIQQMVGELPGMRVAIFVEAKRQYHHDFKLELNRVYRLPTPFTMTSGIRNTIAIYKQLSLIQRENDVLIIQLPFIGFLALPFLKRPSIYHLCANVLTASRNPYKYYGVKRIFSTAFANFVHQLYKYLFKRKNTLLIVNGYELGNLYKDYNPRIVVSSSVYEDEIILTEEIKDRSADGEFQLLFIGRPSKEKGFPTLFAAFVSLLESNRKVTLSLIGIKREDLEDVLDFEVEEKYFAAIQFHGFISWGEKFKQIVRCSHCLLMCSVSEGTPRVLIEAMALGCPVVATRVGGIVGTVRDGSNGLLFEAGDAEGLSKAINVLYLNEAFRQQIIKVALETARKFTLEKFTNEFIQSLKKLRADES